MSNTEQIKSFFPLDSFRPGQRQSIEKVLESFQNGHKFVFLEAPTGSGKSAIGFTLAQFFKSSFYLAPQKFLQDQLTTDFGELGGCLGNLRPMIDLKGRNAYDCNFWERSLNDPDVDLDPEVRKRYLKLNIRRRGCDEGQCKRDGESKLSYCVSQENGVHCAYFRQLYKALNAKVCLMNFHSFLFQTTYAHTFGPRELMILDESHNTEDILLKFIELKISDRQFKRDGITFPELDSVQEYMTFFEDIKLDNLIDEKIKSAWANEDIKQQEEWKRTKDNYNRLKDADPGRWVCVWDNNKKTTVNTVSIKPIFVDDFANQYLFSMADHILFMSATILSKNAMCDALGIKRDEAKSFTLPSTFPAKRRQLLYRPCGSMSFKNKGETLPKMVKEVERLCRYHKDQRGIIHTHNFEIAYKILNTCSKDIRQRLLFQKDIEFDGDKQALLRKHADTANSIIIAPAMHEGLDLKNDLGRFQIICKVPYPSKGDPQIAARMKLSGEYYDWRTATKLIQSYGRIYRSSQDHGITYVLDKDFRRFIDRIHHMVPSWFHDAIEWT